MRLFWIITLLAMHAFGAEYHVAKEASKIQFEATKLLFVGVEGSFRDFEGIITIEDGEIDAINGTVEVSSIDTDDEERDGNLKSEGYFNLLKFPSIEFKSVSIEGNTLHASVRIKEIENTLEFTIDTAEVEKDRVLVKLSTTMNRNLFDLNGPKSGLINDDITVSASLVATKGD